jgi:hypothetical protein
MALDEKQMKKWRVVAGLNVILGGIVLIVQVILKFNLFFVNFSILS